MATLHIEHPIVDFALWSAAFERFAEARVDAGVLSHRVSRPVDDPHYVIIDLEFDDTGRAEGFLTFLRTQVWSSAQTSPALAGDPRALIFEAEDTRARISEDTRPR
jgi:hypothetical protein